MNDDIELSRRRTLAALGTIGAASAGAGLGTSAYFSDQETFQNNELVAGELDMKVDWEEHYSDWSDDEDDPADSADPALDIQMDEPGTPGDYTAFPPGVEAFQGVADDDFVTGDPLLYVHNDDVSQFMDNTSIEAFPDEDNNAVQDDFNQDMACEILADVGNDDSGLDPTAGARSNNDDTMMDGAPAPLINLHDVKPGDFGELTLSFHLCNNPGYVWLNADNVSGAENGVTEPEADDPDEEENQPRPASDDSDSDVVELFDTIQTAWWYDNNCNNLTDGGGGGDSGTDPVDIAFLLDRSGSMDDEKSSLETNITQVANNISADARFALIPYEENTTTSVDQSVRDGSVCETFIDTELTSDPSNLNFDYQNCGGDERASEAIQFALDELSWRSDAQKVVVVLTDEDDSDSTEQQRADAMDQLNTEDACLLSVAPPDNGDDDLRTMATGTVSFSSGSGLADRSVNCGEWIEITDTQGLSDAVLNGISDFITTVASSGESIFFQGTLREALNALGSGNGIPLDGDGGDDFDELDDDPSAAARGCFDPTPETNCIGFSWWLPLDHGNEVQSDSVGFDLGFYTEQCRHNTGSGMNNENVSTNETDA